MKTNHILRPVFLLCSTILFVISSCASSGYTLNEPHNYSNSFNQTIKAVEMVLKDQKMVVVDTENPNDKTYRIYFYKQSSRIDERDFETGHTAEITIRELSNTRTSIEIEEENNRALVRDEYREQIAKEVFRSLNKLLLLEEKV